MHLLSGLKFGKFEKKMFRMNNLKICKSSIRTFGTFSNSKNLKIFQGELNRRRGRLGLRTLCCAVFGLLKNQFLRNNKNKGSRSNVNKHELVYGESSSNPRDSPDVCLSFVLLFTIFIIVVTKKLILQQSKKLTAKCTETQSPPPSIQLSLKYSKLLKTEVKKLNKNRL